EYTPAAKKIMALAQLGYGFLEGWTNQVVVDPVAAFLNTLPVAERFEYPKGATYLRKAGVAGVAFRAADSTAAKQFTTELKKFQAGSILVANPPIFWYPDSRDPARSRAALLKDMKEAFHREGTQGTAINLMQSMMPFWTEKDGLVRFRYEAD